MSESAPRGNYALLIAVLAAGCAAEGMEEDATNTVDGVASSLNVVDVNFSSDPIGPLGTPWSVTPTPSESTATVVGTSDHGRALKLHGSRTSGQFLLAELPVTTSAPQVSVSFQVKPGSGTAFVFFLNAVRRGYRSPRISLQHSPDSNELVRISSYPQVSCGSLPPNSWSEVRIDIHGDISPATYDVRVNGVLKPECTNQGTTLRPPLRSLQLMDASNDGWGGDVFFDDFLVSE